MKNLILVNQVAGPMFIDISNAYVEAGYHVTLLTGQVENAGNKLDNSIRLVNMIKYRRNSTILRISTWLIFSLFSYLILLFRFKKSEVLLVSNPPLVPLLVNYLKWKKNLSYSILIYDIYPDVLENFGYISRDSKLSKWWKNNNVMAFNESVRVFTISNGMKEVLSQYILSDRIEVVYPWVDTSFIKPLNKKDNWFIDKHKLNDKIIIQYSGNMGVTHGLITFIKVAEKIQKLTKYHFLFIGDGVEKNNLVEYCQKAHLKNITFLPFQDSKILSYSIPSADISIVSLAGEANDISIPSKTFYQMAAGNAILCMSNKTSELAKVVMENSCGIVFEPSSVNKISSFLSSVSKKELELLGYNSRKASQKFTKKNAEEFL